MTQEQQLSRLIAPVARYTRFVFVGRSFLWFMIIAIIAALFYTASSNDTNDTARMVFSQIKQVGDMQNIMKNPDFHGLDKDNMPYAISADQAIQKDAETVLLENIRAEMQEKSGRWLSLRAGAGELKNAKKTLMLTKTVDMFYEGGYEFRSDHAFVDMEKSEARSDAHVEGQAPMGTITADSFVATDRGQFIRFDGNVKVTIYRDK